MGNMCYTETDILKAYDLGPDAVLKLFRALQDKYSNAPSPLVKNSANSSFPSSRDLGKKKKNNSREQTGRKPGGQKGHKGTTLRMSDNPDFIISSKPDGCGCGYIFDGSENVLNTKTRQVIDIPKPVVKVTEFQSSSCKCPECGQVHSGQFPDGVNAPVQYGNNLRAAAVYFMNYQLLPFKRTADLFANLFAAPISEGTLRNIQASFAEKVNAPVESIKQQIIKSTTVHFDETGFYAEGERNWLHVASTDKFTHYFHHETRGTTAMNNAGILPQFKGNAIHDFWKPYYCYPECNHGLCNAHHLRDLQGVADSYNYEWPLEMKAFLKRIKTVVDTAKDNGKNKLSPSEIKKIDCEHRELIDKSYKEMPPPPKKIKGVKGSGIKGKAWNLLQRLDLRQNEVLGFVYNFSIPFDNNQAERDIRMMKVKQKISGTFRNGEMAQFFCIIRSYISTAAKHGLSVFDTIADAFNETFFLYS